MGDEAQPANERPNSLGTYLANIRQARGYSLRQVETLTNKAVSNAYVSQIESGKILQPSPNILFSLAGVYKVSYELLMELAGFISSKSEGGSGHGRLATFADMDLTNEEADQLMTFLHFLRETDKKKKAKP